MLVLRTQNSKTLNWTEIILLAALACTVFLLFKKKNNSSPKKGSSDPDYVLLNEIYQKAIVAITEEKLYLIKNLKVSDLAGHIRQNEKLVSRSLNHFGEGNFNYLINRYRVTKAMGMMSSGNYEHFTIEAIGDECGFSNKVSFYNAFKIASGLSPKEFWAQEQLKKNKP